MPDERRLYFANLLTTYHTFHGYRLKHFVVKFQYHLCMTVKHHKYLSVLTRIVLALVRFYLIPSFFLQLKFPHRYEEYAFVALVAIGYKISLKILTS